MDSISAARLAPCPYCYERISPAALWYRCSGRPAAGKQPCEREEDPARKHYLADSEPVLQSFSPGPRLGMRDARVLCPECQGPTGTRVCPECHSVLPDNFTAKSPLFGIAGVRGSGKTVMLAVLGRELTEGVARRFNASIDAVGTSALLSRLSRAREAMERGSGSLPEQTAANERVPAVYSATLQRRGPLGLRRTVSTIFSFYDTAGENLATAERARDQHYLGAASGVILLLDPFGFPQNREDARHRGVDEESLRDEPRTVLRALTDVLRETEGLTAGRKIKKPLAVVLGKIDAFFDQIDPDDPIRRPSSAEPHFDEQESRDLHEHVRALISRWGGDDVLSALDHNYQDYRLFAASALGAEPDYATRRVNARGLQPHRVAEPLLWLMAKRSIIDVKRS